MSDSEDFNSAKDDLDASGASDGGSSDEPLVKTKAGQKPRAVKKTLEKNGKQKSPKKAGRPPGKANKPGRGRPPGRKSPPIKVNAKTSKPGRGRPPGKANKSKIAAKQARVSFSGDPLELSDVDPLNDESEDDEDKEYEVEAIKGHRFDKMTGKLMYSIKWKNYSDKDNTWEECDSLNCPDLLERYNFKNKVVVPKSSFSKRKGKKRGRKPKSKKVKKPRRSSVSGEESDEESVSVSDLCDDGEGDEYEVDEILDVRNKKDGTREFRVHWKSWGSENDTWEPEENLNCAELIEIFMNNLEEAKNSNVKGPRVKHTERFTLSTHGSGRRLSKRHNQKQRVRYDGSDSDESD